MPLHNLHQRVQDHPRSGKQQSEEQGEQTPREDDIMKLPGSIELREGIEFSSKADNREDGAGDPEKHQGSAETDQPDDVHQHPEAVGERVLA